MATPAEMDEAAQSAKVILEEDFSKDEIAKFAVWWKDNYMKAGHKRLGRVLVEAAKERNGEGEAHNEE